MNKENRGAAGLRRSAIAERIRLREEWSALKEIDESTTSSQTVLKKKPVNSRCTPSTSSRKKTVPSTSKKTPKVPELPNDALTGVVALVDVGSEAKAKPLRTTLTSLGATVVTAWHPVVTHLVWTDNGTRSLRARARALACHVVSPLWVEASAAAGRKLRERLFPAASRQSDLPSPRTLRQLLKKAESDNVPLVDLLSDSKDDDIDMPRLVLRISSGTDTSRDKTTDTSNDTIDVESRVNTAPRRGNTTQASRPAPATRTSPKSRRKLFTPKEAPDLSTDEESDTTTKSKHTNKLTQSERRDLARAERMAKKLLAGCNTNTQRNIVATQHGNNCNRIVLTGMSRVERQAITKCIQKMNGVIQNNVTKRTTHVLLGSCTNNIQCTNHASNITGITTNCDLSKSSCWHDTTDRRARTLNALVGAAMGCRVLHARWAVHSAEVNKWLHHHGFEVIHLRKMSQKARVERAALGRMHSDYGYDVFNGMRVRVLDDADQRDAAIQLLKLCGAVVQDVGETDVEIGVSIGKISSKWVFDSVAAARMRTTRRYVNAISLSDI